jgi:hypothetical protein
MKNDTYGEPEIIQGDNIVAYVYSPILTPEERDRRMERIKQAAVRLVLSEKIRKETGTNEQQDTRQSVRARAL